MAIRIEGAVKRYGPKVAAIDGVTLETRPGELLALLGPSGSGKTTLLRAIAGLEFLDAGRILIDGDDATALTARERRIGFVFQNYALFRHLSVFENVAFGLRARPRRLRLTEAEIRDRVLPLLRTVQMEEYAERKPAALSGGQRQRVALARALAIEPRLLLLDEPFGALDAKVRRELRRWLRELHDRLGLSTVFVTHDQEEALELADRVAILNQGRLEQLGTPHEVYDSPATPFVAEFLGDALRVPPRLRRALVPDRPHGGLAMVRPHDIELLPPGGPGVPAIVRRTASRGGALLVELELEDGNRIEAEIARGDTHEAEGRIAPGTRVGLRARIAHLFDDAP
ncbi:sulfate/molybdate ABC transporter ATP-binding protein [Plastoroseomonas hellenica]|uniref:sulfate/molybdate ABC transporter ATP-binding protein n=1 Tax=Plastoroseomonas hellenica TaxID=2687306 RepID=UPI001BAB191C|nr:sulfate/molybdate ABC transporter ATP-binding protein [Plastoroseomonas hellenica]MBR0646022.1 sulfate/molybdate ABC transporter ATP-binding protein [Plastoroseomonas hellenica]